MSYAKLDTRIARNLKILKCSFPAKWTYILGLCYAQDERSDGFIPTDVIAGIGLPVPQQEWVDELVAKAAWEIVPGGYVIHDYLDCNDSAEERAAKTRYDTTRRQAFRARVNARQAGQIQVVETVPARVDPATETDAVVTTPNAPKAAASSPVPPAFDRPTPRGNGAIIQSPLAHERLKASLGYLGARFRVPKTFHEELVSRYGGDEQVARDALEVWYRTLDEAMGPDESIPDIYKFINGHFTVLVQARSAPVPVARKKDDQRQAATDPAWRKQFDDAAKRKAEAK